MTTKIVRGQLVTFTAAPKDYLGNAINPSVMKLYLNYPHLPSGTVSTDESDMDLLSDGTYASEFDTGLATAGTCYASVRAHDPAGASDIKFTITANAANPDIEPTS